MFVIKFLIIIIIVHLPSSISARIAPNNWFFLVHIIIIPSSGRLVIIPGPGRIISNSSFIIRIIIRIIRIRLSISSPIIPSPRRNSIITIKIIINSSFILLLISRSHITRGLSIIIRNVGRLSAIYIYARRLSIIYARRLPVIYACISVNTGRNFIITIIII